MPTFRSETGWLQIGDAASGEGWRWDRRWTATVTATDRRDRIARLLQRRLRSPDRIARSEQQTETLSQIRDTLSIVWLIDFQTQQKFQTEKNFWDRTLRLSGSSEIGEKCVRKTKGEKKKTKALQQESKSSPKKTRTHTQKTRL